MNGITRLKEFVEEHSISKDVLFEVIHDWVLDNPPPKEPSDIRDTSSSEHLLKTRTHREIAAEMVRRLSLGTIWWARLMVKTFNMRLSDAIDSAPADILDRIKKYIKTTGDDLGDILDL